MTDGGDRLGEILDELLGQSSPDRLQRLERLRENDPSLAAELASLLRAHEADPAFLDELDLDAALELLKEDDFDRMPATIGPWRLIRELGRGGLGVVYLAERYGGDFDQQVAIKLIKRGMDSDAILRRFDNERRILASLDHPNIARLIDGGVLDTGQPWFAMDYVDGVSLTRWCEESRLPLRERLALFEQVCQAVQTAHARLVVHRDLKPSNMLVNGQQQVKLLDFGIARVLQPEADGADRLTVVGAPAMTLEYAAPEQIEGGPISVATDVYALGVVLYELLSGAHPYRDQPGPGQSLRALILESHPPPPSAILARHRAASDDYSNLNGRELRGDLDAIVLTAMAADPGQRYSSVEALLKDLWRFRKGLPVRVRSRSRLYRARRFLRRNRFGLAAAAGIFMALMVGLVMTSWQAREAQRQTVIAEQSLDFVLSLLQEARPLGSEQGAELRAVDLLINAADRIRQAEALSPEMQGRIALVIAEGLVGLEAMDQGLELAQLGIDRLEQAAATPDDEVAHGYYILARTLANLGRSDEVTAAVESGLARLENAGEVDDRLRLLRIQLLEMLAVRHSFRGESDQALAIRERAMAERIELFGPDNPRLASAHNNLASALHNLGRFEDALGHFEQAGRLIQLESGPDHPHMAYVQLGIGATLMGLGTMDQAESTLERARALAERRLGADSNVVTSAIHALGQLRRYQNRLPEARQLLTEAANRSAAANALADEGRSLTWLGLIELAERRPAAARARFERAREVLAASGNSTNPQHELAVLGMEIVGYWVDGRQPELDDLDARLRSLAAVDHMAALVRAEAAELLASLYFELGMQAQARASLEQAQQAFAAVFGPEHPRTLAVGRVYRSPGAAP